MKCTGYKSNRHIDSVFSNISECARLLKRANDSLQSHCENDSIEVFSRLAKCASLIKQCNRMITDSKGKRGKYDRPTNWEIKTVIGLKEGLPFNRNDYIAQKDESGGITVMSRASRKILGHKEGWELDQLAMNQKLQNIPNQFKSPRLSIPNVGTPNNMQGTQKSVEIANALNALAKVTNLTAQIVMTVGALGAGVAGLRAFGQSIINGAKGIASKVANKVRELRR